MSENELVQAYEEGVRSRDVLQEAIAAIDGILDFLFKRAPANPWDTLWEKLVSQLQALLTQAWSEQQKKAIEHTLAVITAGKDKLTPQEVNTLLEDLQKLLGPGMAEQVKAPVGKIQLKAYGDAHAEIGVKVSFNKTDQEALQWLGADSLYWIGEHYSRDLSDKLQATAQEAISQGMSREQAGIFFEQQFSAAFSRSRAYWEGLSAHIVTRAREFGRTSAYQKAGVTHYKIVAVMDKRTTKICQFMNGRVLPIDKATALRSKLIKSKKPEDTKTIAPWLTEAEVEQIESTPWKNKTTKLPIGLALPPYHFNCRSRSVIALESEVPANAKNKTSGEGTAPAPPPKPKPKQPKKPIELPKPGEPPPIQQPEPVLDTTAWPADLTGLKHIRSLGGSTGAELVQDPRTGRRFVLKRGASAEQAIEEITADRAYTALGVLVPEGKLYTDKQGPVRMTEYIDGLTLTEMKEAMSRTPKVLEEALEQVRQGFVADALLANWDIYGDNLMWDPKTKKVYRIDNGGALRFRAQGKRKTTAEFGPDVTELQSMRDKNRAPGDTIHSAEIFGSLTDKQVQEQIKRFLASKQQLLESLPPDLRPIMEQRLDYLQKQIQQGRASSSDFSKAITQARASGRELKIDRDDIEDISALIWEDNAQSKKHDVVTRARFKMTMAGAAKVEETVKPFLTHQQETAPRTLSDPYWPTLLAAIKTANTHHADGNYNEAALNQALQLKAKLQDWKATTANEKAMKKHYQQVLEEIEQAHLNKKKTTVLEPYQYDPALEPKPKRPEGLPTDITFHAGPLAWTAKNYSKGYGEDTNVNVWNSMNQGYTIKIGDVTLRTMPYKGMKLEYAFQGLVEADIPGGATPENLAKLRTAMNRLGLDTSEPTPAYKEYVYLSRTFSYRKWDLTLAGRSKYEEITLSRTMSDQEKVGKLKALALDEFNVDLVKKPPKGYDPEGKTSNPWGDGRSFTQRWDITEEDIERKMANQRVYHASSNLRRFVTYVVDQGGDLTSTSERLRKGVPIRLTKKEEVELKATGGLSPEEDIATGGANYFYTRISEPDSEYVDGRIYWKPGILARQDAQAFDGDWFGGNCREGLYGEKYQKARKTTIPQMQQASEYTSNETIFKWGINLFDPHLDKIVFESRYEVEDIIKFMKSRGYKKWPDGRRLEDVIVAPRENQ